MDRESNKPDQPQTIPLAKDRARIRHAPAQNQWHFHQRMELQQLRNAQAQAQERQI